jgi:hypothetical protein
VTSTGAITISTASNGNINLQPNGTGNIILANTFVNGVAYPAQDQDAASKIYVDNMVSTALTYHAAVTVATTGTLATATGGTITYAQPNGAGNGVGATLTTTGSFYLIDTANIQTVGTRILVKNEANAVYNGVYTYANVNTIVRSTDTDEYGPASTEQISINDYFFVQSGNVNAGAAFVVDAPLGTITFGTSNISFAQFSSSQTYTANTNAGISIIGTVINAKVDNDTTAFDGGGNIIVKASANLVTPNIGAATGTSVSVTGTVSAGNINADSGYVTTTGNITGGNLLTGGLISATSTITGSSILGSVVSASGNVYGGNVLFDAGVVTGTGNIYGGNLIAALFDSTNTTLAGPGPGNTSGERVRLYDFANPSTTNFAIGVEDHYIWNAVDNGISGFKWYAGNVLAATLMGTGNLTVVANIAGGNILTTGLISATGAITSAANITGGNVLFGSGVVSGTGNIYGQNIYQASYQVLDTQSTIDGGTY